MPKEVLNINEFDGGMNNHTHDKDIEDNELALVQNMCVAHKGSIESGYLEEDLQSAITVTPNLLVLPKNKQLLVYKTDFNYSSPYAEGEYTFLLSTDGDKLYRYEGSSWVTKLNLEGAITNPFPSLIVYDGQVRFSDGSFVLNTSNQQNNKTKLLSVVRRKYWNADNEVRYELAQNASISKPTSGVVGFDTTVSTVGGDKGYLGLEINKSVNTVLQAKSWTSGTSNDEIHQLSHSSVFVGNSDVIGQTDIYDANVLLTDKYGSTFTLAQINEGATYTPTTEFGTHYNNTNYELELSFADNDYFYIPVTIGNDFIGNDKGSASVNQFTASLLGRNYVSSNGGSSYSEQTSQNSWNEFSYAMIGLNADGTHHSTYSATITNNSGSLCQLSFTGSDVHKAYLLKIRFDDNAGLLWKIRFQKFELQKQIRSTVANGYFGSIALSSHDIGNIGFNNFLNTEHLNLDNLINIRLALYGTATMSSISFHFAQESFSSGSDMFGSNPYYTYTLGSDWIESNKGQGWKNVSFPISELIPTGTPVLSSCNNFGVTINGTASSSNYLYIDGIDMIQDNRGSWDGNYKFFYSWIYDRIQESGFFEFPNQADGVVLDNHRVTAKHVIREVDSGGFENGARRITGANVYYAEYNKTTNALKYDDPFLLANVNFETGVEKAGGQLTENWVTETINGQAHHTHALFEFIDPPTSSTFSVTSGYDYIPSESIEFIRFKAGVSLNRRMYYGNVELTYENVTGQTNPLRERFSDRIYKSLIDQPDIIPSYNYVDVAINDGDSIVAMMAYADRLLVYKLNTMYLINATQEIEYIEDVFKYKGVWSSSAVTESDRGVLWVNENGCFHYNGEQVEDLTTKKLDQANWSLQIGLEPTIFFEPKERHVIILGQQTTHGWLVDLDTKAWSYLATVKSNNTTNAVLYEGNIIYGIKETYTDGEGGGGSGGGG
mgnify:CR=1 FL=1